MITPSDGAIRTRGCRGLPGRTPRVSTRWTVLACRGAGTSPTPSVEPGGGTTAAEMLRDVLARQQAQLKTSEQLRKAVTKGKGHIMGKLTDSGDNGRAAGTGDGTSGAAAAKGRGSPRGSGGPKMLEEDLALMESKDGCWDDSDDNAVADRGRHRQKHDDSQHLINHPLHGVVVQQEQHRWR